MTEPYDSPQSARAPSEGPGGAGGTLASRPWGRPLGVLVSPLDTFRSIAARPSWLPPLLVLLVLFLAAQLVAMQKIDLEAAVREAMERQGQPVDDEQVERFAGIQAKAGVACNAVLFPTGVALVAVLFWGLANVAGGEIGFRRSFAVTTHGLMPNAVSSLLTVPVALGRQEIDVAEAQQGILASHLGILAPADAPVMDDGAARPRRSLQPLGAGPPGGRLSRRRRAVEGRLGGDRRAALAALGRPGGRTDDARLRRGGLR